MILYISRTKMDKDKENVHNSCCSVLRVKLASRISRIKAN
jgi:hypothetical protein